MYFGFDLKFLSGLWQREVRNLWGDVQGWVPLSLVPGVPKVSSGPTCTGKTAGMCLGGRCLVG